MWEVLRRGGEVVVLEGGEVRRGGEVVVLRGDKGEMW